MARSIKNLNVKYKAITLIGDNKKEHYFHNEPEKLF